MTRDRCWTEAELGECPRCGRNLCVGCYDSDQDRRCCDLPLELRNRQIKELGLTTPIEDIAARYGLSRRSVFRVLA